MFKSPERFHEFLSENGYVDEIYSALADDDLSEVTITVYNILKKTKHLPPILKSSKSEEESARLCQLGNEMCSVGKSQIAMIYYNKALMFAPKNSEAMRLASDSRSALTHKLKRYIEYKKDFESSLAIDDTSKFREKFMETLRSAEKESKDDMGNQTKNDMINDLLEFKFVPHKHISSISNMLDVSYKLNQPKIFAVSDIKVGATVAVEKSYVCGINSVYAQISCHYCNKFALDLIPCDGCSHALFCNRECRNRCINEYHVIECQIMGIYPELCDVSRSTLTLKSVLKMQSAAKSWKELIEVSQNLGVNRSKKSSLYDVFDPNKKYALLHAKDDTPFKYGQMYNSSFLCALVMHYLDNVPSFLPQMPEQRQQARRALARLLMFTQLYCAPIHNLQCAEVIYRGMRTELVDQPNYGFFSFTDKLKKSCTSYNVMAVSLNNKMALVAVKPIKPGTDIIIPYWPNGIDYKNERHKRKVQIFLNYRDACVCESCTGSTRYRSFMLSDAQKLFYKNLNVGECRNFEISSLRNIFPKVVDALTVLSDVDESDEFLQVLKVFRRCILFFQSYECCNVTIDSI